MKDSLSVSAFFPAYNDSATIASLVITAHLTLASFCRDYEIIVINDGSRDHTLEVLRELERKYAFLKVVDHGVNRGYGAALRTGFATASKDWIFYTDGDAQYDVREMVKLAGQAVNGVDVVNGYKIERNDPYYRTLIGGLYNFLVKRLFGLKIRDTDCDFRLIRRSVFDRVQLEASSGVICVEMVRRFQDAGCVFREVPVHHFFRAFGRSQFFNFRRLWRTLIELLLFRMKLWRENRDVPAGAKPLPSGNLARPLSSGGTLRK